MPTNRKVRAAPAFSSAAGFYCSRIPGVPHPAVSGDLLLDFSHYQKSEFYDQTHQNLENQKPLMNLEQAYDHAGCCSSCLGWKLKLVALFYDHYLVDVLVRWALEEEELADDEEEGSQELGQQSRYDCSNLPVADELHLLVELLLAQIDSFLGGPRCRNFDHFETPDAHLRKPVPVYCFAVSAFVRPAPSSFLPTTFAESQL